jgi:site-specific recombinase XerD
MNEYMVLRNYKTKTIETYLYHMREFIRFSGCKSPDVLTVADARRYLFHLKDSLGTSWSNVNHGICSLNLFYKKVLERDDWDVGKIPRPIGERRLPVVLSRNEINELFEAARKSIYRVIFMVIYSGGLRIREAAYLRVRDIDSDNMHIDIRHGKGNHDRSTLLSRKALNALREYWLENKPSDWLFPGKDGKRPCSTDSIRSAFHRAKKKPGFIKLPKFTACATASQPICLKTA